MTTACTVGCGGEVADRLAVEVVAGVVLGGLRRRADDDQHLLAIEPELAEHRGVGLEVGQVVLLLQARVADQLALLGADLLQPLERDRVRASAPCAPPGRRSGAASRRTRSPASAPRGCGRARRRRRGRPSRGRSPGRAGAPRRAAPAAPSARPAPGPCRAPRRRRGCPPRCTGMPSRSRIPSVCPYSRAVTRTSSPRASNRSISGRRTSGCAAAVQSTQTFSGTAEQRQPSYERPPASSPVPMYIGGKSMWMIATGIALRPHRRRSRPGAERRPCVSVWSVQACVGLHR